MLLVAADRQSSTVNQAVVMVIDKTQRLQAALLNLDD
jgi:hypothetical protein